MRLKSALTFIDARKATNFPTRILDVAQDANLHLRIVVLAIAQVRQRPSYDLATQAGSPDLPAASLDHIDGIVQDLKRTLQQRGLAGDVVRHVVEERDVARLAGLHARYADLPVLYRSLDTDFGQQDLLSGLIFQSGRPLLVVPPGRDIVVNPRRVVVAWNGRLEAARALHASLDMLSGAERVLIVMVDPSSKEWGNGEEPGFDIAAVLARHGIPIDVLRRTSKGREPGLLLLETAQKIEADLVVMGAYGHSRMLEWVLGGTSRHMLAEADVPVFMMH